MTKDYRYVYKIFTPLTDEELLILKDYLLEIDPSWKSHFKAHGIKSLVNNLNSGYGISWRANSFMFCKPYSFDIVKDLYTIINNLKKEKSHMEYRIQELENDSGKFNKKDYIELLKYTLNKIKTLEDNEKIELIEKLDKNQN